jgi:hypothetical protein
VRKLIGLILALAILAVGLSIVDVVVRHRVQTIIADKIEHDVPGTQATVNISSFPFLGHLAVSGDVPEVTARVTGVKAGTIPLNLVTVHAYKVDVDRNQLFQGTVKLRSIQRVAVSATVTQATLDSQLGLPVTLGDGTVGLAGIQAPADLTVTGTQVRFSVMGLPPINLDIPVTSLLPCLGGAHLTPGILTVTCTTSQIPPVLEGISGSL